MNLPSHFYPSRRRGLIFQIGLVLALLAGSGLCFWQAVAVRVGVIFMLYLLLGLLLVAPVPLLIYRTYALLGAHYTLERDGLRIRWGLRAEDIPLPDIEWMRLATDLPALFVSEKPSQIKSIPLPWLHWPGSLIGIRQVEGLGGVEYIASDERSLVLIATPRRIFAISPADPDELLRSFNRINELGSLTPLSARSLYPTFLLARIWADRLARPLILASLLLGLALLVWVGLAIPAHTQIALGFNPFGSPVEPGPPERLLLLPVLYGLTYLAAFLGGMFFYRRPDQQPIAYLLWGGTVVEGVLLIAAVVFITKG